jgi:hypothetical protein
MKLIKNIGLIIFLLFWVLIWIVGNADLKDARYSSSDRTLGLYFPPYTMVGKIFGLKTLRKNNSGA